MASACRAEGGPLRRAAPLTRATPVNGDLHTSPSDAAARAAPQSHIATLNYFVTHEETGEAYSSTLFLVLDEDLFLVFDEDLFWVFDEDVFSFRRGFVFSFRRGFVFSFRRGFVFSFRRGFVLFFDEDLFLVFDKDLFLVFDEDLFLVTEDGSAGKTTCFWSDAQIFGMNIVFWGPARIFLQWNNPRQSPIKIG